MKAKMLSSLTQPFQDLSLLEDSDSSWFSENNVVSPLAKITIQRASLSGIMGKNENCYRELL